jgi:serine protein kinase
MKNCSTSSELTHAPRAGHPGNAGALLDSVAPERAGKLEHLLENAVYDGESLKDTDPKAKSYQEYRDYAGG